MDSFLFSLNATVPVFAVMVIGYFLKHRGLLNESFAKVADKFVFRVCLPCMVFLDLADTDIRNTFDLSYVGFCFAATLSSILIIWLITKKIMKDKDSVGAFVQGAYRSSAAILGLAFINNIYGSSGMAPLMIIGSVPLYNIFAVVILVLEAKSARETQDGKERIKKACVGVLTNPIIIGIFLGLIASFFRIPLPHIVNKTISNLGVMASPLALVSIGTSFQGRKALAKYKPTAMAAFIKLILLAALVLPLAVWCGFRDQKLIAIVIMLASPTTPTSYIMAKNMDGDDVLASSIVVTTTLLSSITLTGWIFIMRSLALIQ